MPPEPPSFAPLASVRVLDLTTSIAGPYCSLILAALGALVIKVERPGAGDDTRSWGPPFWGGQSAVFLAMNAGKRSLAVDLSTEKGRDVVRRLAETTDVFLQNLRPGAVERLGLGFAELAELNDRLVYCSIGAFGSRGPLAGEPGYDPLMQAAGGIMSLTGEEGGEPVRTGPSIVDQGTAMWCAIGILAALRARDEGAGPQLIDTSLYETAVNWVPYQLVGHLASGRVPDRQGTGVSILAPYEAFEARDGPLMIAAGNDRLFAALCETIGLPHLAADERFATNANRVANRARLASEIARRVAEEDVATWVDRLRAAGVPVSPIQDLAQVAASEQTAALGLLQDVPHPDVPDLRLVSLPLTIGGVRLSHASPPPAAAGEDTVSVLREAGFADGVIHELLAAGAVAAPAGAAT
jgi:crotonobetainyl-CoA:carnitine CoA-transferase CaiB-like acyl-CoA transferase